MCRAAAIRLRRYLRRAGIACHMLRHAAPDGRFFYTVERDD